jgi:hypothetical protein
MEERKASERLKQRFEQAGFRIAESVDFNEHGLRFDLDGFDAEAKVGYEYVTDEAGDGWDVDDDVVVKLTDLRKSGALHVLVIDEEEAPDEASLDRAIDEFLGELKERGIEPVGASAGASAAASAAASAPATGGAVPPPIPKARPLKVPKGARKKKS